MRQSELARGFSRSPGMALLLCLVLGMVVASGSVLAHVHDDAGYYNEQHVLGSVATRAGDSPAPDAPALASVAVVAAPVVPLAETTRATSRIRSTDPRAPPTV